MLVLKKSLMGNGYGARIGDDLRDIFDGRFHAKPEVLSRLGDEWRKWEGFHSYDRGHEYRDRITASDEGNFWRVRFCKSAFRGEPGYDRFEGTWTKDITVYRDSISSNGPIYKKRGLNR